MVVLIKDTVLAILLSLFALFIVTSIFAIAIAFFVWNIMCIVDASQRSNWGEGQADMKVLWMVLLITGLVFGFGWIVCIVYYYVVRKPLGKAIATPTVPQTAITPDEQDISNKR